MTQEGALLITMAFTVVLLAVGLWAWRRRARRDSGIAAPYGELAPGAAVHAVFPVLYVATTRHDEPLERLAIRGLAFRSRADLTVADGAVAVDLTGQPRFVLAAADIDDVGQATVAIDRVVEKDGLVRLVWRSGTDLVDSYFRGQESSARDIAATISGILPSAPTPTGTLA